MSNNHSSVIARLGRAIQYSRDGSASLKSRGVLDARLKRGMTVENDADRPSQASPFPRR
jgi:hypothetical protein